MNERKKSAEAAARELAGSISQREIVQVTVTFQRSKVVVAWNPAVLSILELAEGVGVFPPFSCRAGVCGTCVSKITVGTVTYFESPVVELGEDEILLCCSRPAESVVIDI